MLKELGSGSVVQIDIVFVGEDELDPAEGVLRAGILAEMIGEIARPELLPVDGRGIARSAAGEGEDLEAILRQIAGILLNFGEEIDEGNDQLLKVLNRASFKIKNLVDGILTYYAAALQHIQERIKNSRAETRGQEQAL